MMGRMNRVFPITPAFLAACCLLSARAGSVIFIHPDGAGLAHWQAARFLIAGPDGDLNWDRLPHIGVYRGPMRDNLTASSNGGAVAHATGVRPEVASFGLEPGSGQRLVSLSGRRETILGEAIRRGLRTGLINSGDITEPGTAVFAAATPKREDKEEIARQVLECGADVIMSGGEKFMLPEGAAGRHTKSGTRRDGRNLIEEAKKRGYAVVYNRDELAKAPASAKKLLGVFAEGHTFNDKPMGELKSAGLPLYKPGAPTLAEMTAKALEMFDGQRFFLVVEEEGSDNFGNANNAPGTFEALRRADEAIGAALEFLARNPDTLLLTAADSEAGALDVIGLTDGMQELAMLAKLGRDRNGAPLGLDEDGEPYLSAPDREGKRHPFVAVWGTLADTSGGILARAAGRGAERVRGTVFNTDICRIMRETLFEGLSDGEPALEKAP